MFPLLPDRYGGDNEFQLSYGRKQRPPPISPRESGMRKSVRGFPLKSRSQLLNQIAVMILD